MKNYSKMLFLVYFQFHGPIWDTFAIPMVEIRTIRTQKYPKIDPQT